MPRIPHDIKEKLELTKSMHNGHGFDDFVKFIEVDHKNKQEIADLMNVTRQTAWGWYRDYLKQYKMEGMK